MRVSRWKPMLGLQMRGSSWLIQSAGAATWISSTLGFGVAKRN
jgi:hypothetical protein